MARLSPTPTCAPTLCRSIDGRPSGPAAGMEDPGGRLAAGGAGAGAAGGKRLRPLPASAAAQAPSQPQKGGQKRGHSALSDRACNMTQYCSTAQFQRPRQQQQQQASSSPHATQRSKTPRYLYILRILVIISMSAMLTAGSAAGGALTRNLAGGRYFIGGRVNGQPQRVQATDRSARNYCNQRCTGSGCGR